MDTVVQKHGHQNSMISDPIHQLAGSVNTFIDSRLEKCAVLSKGFWRLQETCLYPLQMACSPVQVGRGVLGLLPDRTQGAGNKPPRSAKFMG